MAEAAAPEQPQEEQAPQEEPQPVEEFCEIALWRGYAKSRFYARLGAGDGAYEIAVAESPPFRLRANATPEESNGAAASHRALVEALIEDGWETVGAPNPWYASKFRRALSTEPEPLAPLVQT